MRLDFIKSDGPASTSRQLQLLHFKQSSCQNMSNTLRRYLWYEKLSLYSFFLYFKKKVFHEQLVVVKCFERKCTFW